MKKILFLVLATICGYLGASVHSMLNSVSAEENRVVRATRFELISPSGDVLAFLGENENKDIALGFLDQGHHSVATVGMSSVRSPLIYLTGPDGKSRLTFALGSMNRPYLVMGDEKWEGRLRFGFLESDAPTMKDNDWGLEFLHPNMLSIGVDQNPVTKALTGRIFINDGKRELFRVPKLGESSH